MPVMRVKEIREMSSDDRMKKLDELRTELVRLRTMTGAGGSVENPARLKILRKSIARIMTVDHEETYGTGKTEEQKRKKK